MSCQSHPKAQPAVPSFSPLTETIICKIKTMLSGSKLKMKSINLRSLFNYTIQPHYKELETPCFSETLSFFIYSLLAASGP